MRHRLSPQICEVCPRAIEGFQVVVDQKLCGVWQTGPTGLHRMQMNRFNHSGIGCDLLCYFLG